jgi:hypothetical protein
LGIITISGHGRQSEELVPVVLVVVIVVAWMIVLGPNLWKRRSQAGGINSISHFHRSLRILERSGPPPIVTPAYRLRAVDPPGRPARDTSASSVGGVPVLTVVGAAQLPRPALAFLGEQPPQEAPGSVPVVAMDERRVGRTSAGLSSRAADLPSRSLVRKRRRDTLGILGMVFVVTVLVGLVPGASVALVLSAVPGVALLVYVALLVSLRREAEERERTLHYLDPRILEARGARPAAAVGASGAGRVPVYMSGRYAHPSNQAVVAR